MHVNVGHIVFPVPILSQEAQTVSVKRVKREGAQGVAADDVRFVRESVVAAVRVALREAVDGTWVDDVFIDVHVHEGGKGVSFSFVKGFLSLSLSTPAGTEVCIPAGLTFDEIQNATGFPSFTQVRLHFSDEVGGMELPVYWEKRVVCAATPTALVAVEGRIKTPGTNIQYAADKDIVLLDSRVLVVGAGGIGCELLKVLVLYGFSDIDVFDLDTVDATNLNRQFLFNRDDVGQSKSATARQAIMNWFTSANPRRPPNIRAHHANIKDEAYGKAFFAQFAVVLNALDNVSARQCVNRMCKQAGVPLVESGTMGYNGQVQPIVYGRYECYDCHPKASGKQTLAVCTVHARPTTMVHCVHYAKELYERLFGDGQQDAGDELTFVDDLLNQEKERQGINTENGKLNLHNLAVSLGCCLFVSKIEELLSIKSAWPTQPPSPLEPTAIHGAAEQLKAACDNPQGVVPRVTRDCLMSLNETALLFVDAFVRCASRGQRVAFRKEDDDAVDFVAGVSNLRALIFHISPQQSVEEIRSIAGAIVPAIATTNAVIAAGVVQQAVRVLFVSRGGNQPPEPKMIYVRKVPQVRRRRLSANPSAVLGGNGKLGLVRWVSDMYLVHSAPPNPASDKCLVCCDRHPTVDVYLNAKQVTFELFVHRVLQQHLNMHEPTIFHGASILYEKGDYEALNSTPLLSQMKDDHRPLDLLVDDLDHDVEWRVVVHHCEELKEQVPQSGVVVEGLEEALKFESSLLAMPISTADPAAIDAGDAVGEANVPAGGCTLSKAAVPVLIDSGDEDSDEVVEID